MAKNYECIVVIMITFLLLILPQLAIQGVYAAEVPAQNNLRLFLSDVLGIDLAQYNVTQSGYDASYPEQFGGLVEEEVVSYTFAGDDGSQLNANAIFRNSFLTSCSLSVFKGKIIYKQAPAAYILNQAKSVLQKYQTYASQKYATDASYIQGAQRLLNTVSKIVSSNITTDNIQLSISQTSKPNVPGSSTHLTWSHIENGTLISRKSLSIDFQDQTLLHFADTYGLYKVGCLCSISKDEALELGFAAAKNYQVSLVAFGENGSASAIQMQPDWSNYTYDIYLAMIPGESAYGETINPPPGSSLSPVQLRYQSNVTRDPLALYPLWKMTFYFNKPIGEIYGIQVGVWGDSKEISYCIDYCLLGTTPISSPTTVQSRTPRGSQTLSPSTTDFASDGFLGSSLPAAHGYTAICAISVIVAVGSYLFIRKRK